MLGVAIKNPCPLAFITKALACATVPQVNRGCRIEACLGSLQNEGDAGAGAGAGGGAGAYFDNTRLANTRDALRPL